MAAAERAAEVQAIWGHPAERWQSLIGKVQNAAVRDFSAVIDEWLSYMWCLDQYRIADVPPKGMGDPTQPYSRRLDGIYRGKGNSFATLLSLLLRIAPARPFGAGRQSRAIRRTTRSTSRGLTAV